MAATTPTDADEATKRFRIGSSRNLVRRYLVLSLLVTVLVIVLVAFLAEEAARRTILASEAETVEQTAKFLWDQISEHLLETEQESIPGPTPTGPDALPYVVVRFQRLVKVAYLNLIRSDGKIIFSTNPDWQGKTAPHEEFWHDVVGGTPHTELKPAGAVLDLGGVAKEPLLESNVLVGELVRDGVRTPLVIEIYQPASRIVDALRGMRNAIVLGAGLSLVAMVLAHLWLFLQGHRTIVARTRELEDLSRHLEEEVRARTLELATSRRLADVGRLAAGVAHEINTPIASIATCADGLLGRVDDPETRRYLEIVRNEAFRVKTITRTLLDFSRAGPAQEAGKAPRPVEVGVALREVFGLLAFSLRERRITVELEVEPEDLAVLCDPSDLHQILLNLMANAMDALPNGGTIHWDAKVRGEQVRIRCQDDGIGISKELLPQVMDPFVTTKAPGQGTGLGLPLAWALARRHGGSLTLDSEGPGRGAISALLLARA